MRCAGKNPVNFDYIKKIFAEEGFEVLDEEYLGTTVPIRYRCKCGYEASIRWNTFKKGSRCRNCDSIKKSFDYTYVKNYFLEYNCELLSKEYKNCLTSLSYRCSCGCIAKTTFSNFKRKKRCRKCGMAKGSNHYKWRTDREQVALEKSIKKKCRSMLFKILKMTDQYKLGHTFDILGYSPMQLLDSLKLHENWDKINRSKWHLDHIFPIKTFLDYAIYDISVINCLENLQPLSEQENLSKSAKYDRVEFEKWLTNKGVKWLVK
jgi:rubredoxin